MKPNHIIIIATLLIGTAFPSLADPLKIGISTFFEEQYNDNIFYDADNPSEDGITHIAQSIRARWIKEAAQLQLNGSWDAYDYHTFDRRDTVDRQYSGELNKNWSPRFSTRFSAGYIHDQRPDRELAETGLLFDNDRRIQNHCDIFSQYLLDEITAASFTYAYRNDAFSDERTYDSYVHTVQVLFTRNLSAIINRFTGRFQMVGGFYGYQRDYETAGPFGFRVDVDDQQKIDYYSAGVGMVYAITEKMDITGDFGARYTKINQNFIQDIEPNLFSISYAPIEVENDSRGYVLSFNIDYRYGKGNFTASASHDLVPASGSEGTVERTSARISGHHKLSSAFYVNWATRGFLNRSDNDGVTADEDEINVQVNLAIGYTFNPFWDVRVSATTNWFKDRETDETRRQNRAVFRLSCNLPAME